MKQFIQKIIPKKGKPETKEESIWDIVRFTIIALLIVIPLRMFVAQPFIVSGDSMFPTFHNSEYLIIDELSYRITDPHRGDVIVFRYPKNPSRFFIKRVIGLPGETITIHNNKVTIVNTDNPQGFVLDEPYVDDPVLGNVTTVLKDNEYFVMGDNRPASSDSRAWGPLPENYIIGRAFLRILPINKASIMPGHVKGFQGITQE